MAVTIKLKNASGSDPSASDLVVGEVAIRTDLGKLFTKKDNGSVAEISGGGIDDGDKGDITVSNSGATFTIDNDAVTYAKIQNVSATNRILGRDSSGAGVIEEITPANLRTMINVENGATADQSAAEIRSLVESASDSNVFTDADHSKLNGIAANATNVTNNNQLTNGAGYITSYVNTQLSNEQVQDIVGAMVSGNSESGITVTYQDSDGTLDFSVASQTDQNFTNADHTKLNGIETGATADQTGSEIASALNGQNVYTTGAIGRDSTDHIGFTNNTRMDITINGNNEFRFEADGDFHADGDVIAQSTTVSSDKRIKENIEPVSDSLKKVQALNGVSFDWKKTGEKSAGVIAQEVIGVLPEAVKEVTPVGGGDSHLTVNYHALTSILIEAIKELKAELDEHKGGA